MTEQKNIRRFEVAVVGVTFEGRQDLLAKLHSIQEKGDTVLTGQLKREAENPYDPNAVAVEVVTSQIGYIPKALAAKLAARIDSGESIDVVGVRIIMGSKDNRTVYGARIDVEIQAENEKEAV
jgi:hypothetical protein